MSDIFLFGSADAALRFAFGYSLSVRIGSPIGNLMPSSGAGNGLVGVDGAAQAGMIKAEVEKAGEYGAAAITARYAPASIDCTCGGACCAGYRDNPEWIAAVSVLAASSIFAVAGCISKYHLRLGIVKRYFGARVKLSDLAQRCAVNIDTASAHNAKIVRYLKGVETQAWNDISNRLSLAGIVDGKKVA